MICDSCHWLYDRDGERDPLEIDSRGKVSPCINIGAPGWEHWEGEQKAPEECADYVKKGEHESTGLWAGVAELVREVGRMVEADANRAVEHLWKNKSRAVHRKNKDI